jgi:thiamine pyrophosphate-dependent acetolactate synthase large subunit-like protein
VAVLEYNFDNPNFPQFAKSFGAKGIQVQNLGEFEEINEKRFTGK